MKLKIIIAFLMFSIVCSSGFAAKNETQIEGQIFIVTKGQQTYKLSLVQVYAIPASTMEKAIQERANTVNAGRQALLPQIISAKAERDQAAAENRGSEYSSLVRVTAEASRRCKEMGGMAFVNCMNSPEMTDLRARTDRAREVVKPAQASLLASIQMFTQLTKQYEVQGSQATFFEGLAVPSDMAIVSDKTDADGKFSLKLPSGKRFMIFARAKRQVMSETEEYVWLLGEADAIPKKLFLTNDNLVETHCAECVNYMKGMSLDPKPWEKVQTEISVAPEMSTRQVKL